MSFFDLGRVFTYSSYYFLLVLVIMWLGSLGYFLKSSSRKFIRLNKWNILTALILSILTFSIFTLEFKTNSDESNLLSTARSFSLDKKSVNVTESIIDGDEIRSEIVVIPKRPLLFQFMTSLVYSVTKVEFYPPFIVNFFVLFFLLILVSCFWENLNFLEKLCVQLLILSQAIIPIYATSAGFDLLANFLVLLMLFFASKSIRESKFELPFLMTGIILTQARYESIAFFVVIYICRAIYLKQKNWLKHLKNILLVAFFQIPNVLQRLLSLGKFEQPKGESLFSVSNFIEHLLNLIKGHFIFDKLYPFNSYLLLIGALCSIYIFYRYHKNFKVLGLCILTDLSMVIFLSHHAGEFIHPAQSRFFMFYTIFISLMIIKVIRVLNISFKYYVPFILSMFLISFNTGGEKNFVDKLILNKELKFIYKKVLNDKEIKTLYIYHRPGQITAVGRASIHEKRFNKARSFYFDMLKSKKINRIIHFKISENKNVLIQNYGLKVKVSSSVFISKKKYLTRVEYRP